MNRPPDAIVAHVAQNHRITGRKPNRRWESRHEGRRPLAHPLTLSTIYRTSLLQDIIDRVNVRVKEFPQNGDEVEGRVLA